MSMAKLEAVGSFLTKLNKLEHTDKPEDHSNCLHKFERCPHGDPSHLVRVDSGPLVSKEHPWKDFPWKCPAYASRWIAQTNWKIRMLGSAALEAIQVAAGVAHGAVTVNGKLWDIAAPAAVLLEAGAVLTDFSGRPIFPLDLKNYQGAKVPFLAAGPSAHAVLLKEIQQYG